MSKGKLQKFAMIASYDHVLEPTNEEAIYMLMNIELKKSNYLEVKKLAETFSKVCKDLCEKKDLIMDSLKNLEPKNES